MSQVRDFDRQLADERLRRKELEASMAPAAQARPSAIHHAAIPVSCACACAATPYTARGPALHSQGTSPTQPWDQPYTARGPSEVASGAEARRKSSSSAERRS